MQDDNHSPDQADGTAQLAQRPELFFEDVGPEDSSY